MSLRPTVRTALAALALAGLVAGCSGSDSGTATPETSSAAESTSAAPSSSAEETSSAAESTSAAPSAPVGDFTPKGTTLALGEQATVPFESSDVTGAVGVTVDRIDAGTPADLEPLDLGDRAAGLTPFYVRFTVTNLSGSDFSFSSLGNTHGVLEDGTNAQRLSIIGDFPQCESESAGSDFTTVGATYTTCEPWLAGGSAQVVGGDYADSESDDPALDYSDEPIVWK